MKFSEGKLKKYYFLDDEEHLYLEIFQKKLGPIPILELKKNLIAKVDENHLNRKGIFVFF